MTRRRTPVAIDVRHIGAAVVLVFGVVATVLARRDLTHVLLVWFAALLYLAFCMEPMRRVLRNATVTWTLATIFVFDTLCCVGFASCLPADADTGSGSFSLASLVFGNDRLSDTAQARYFAATWLCFAGLAIGTLALWYQVLRLARRSEWKSIDHSTGDASFLADTSLRRSRSGTSVTRAAQPRPTRSHPASRR